MKFVQLEVDQFWEFVSGSPEMRNLRIIILCLTDSQVHLRFCLKNSLHFVFQFHECAVQYVIKIQLFKWSDSTYRNIKNSFKNVKTKDWKQNRRVKWDQKNWKKIPKLFLSLLEILQKLSQRSLFIFFYTINRELCGGPGHTRIIDENMVSIIITNNYFVT